MTTQHLPKEALVLGPDEGIHLHLLNHLATIKMAGEGGSMSVVEFLAPRGFGPPLHSHRREDELFVILDGKSLGPLGRHNSASLRPTPASRHPAQSILTPWPQPQRPQADPPLSTAGFPTPSTACTPI